MGVWKILIICVIMLCALAGDYIIHVRKIYKINRENLHDQILKLYENKEKGESLLNVLGIMYVPTVVGMLEETSNQCIQILIFL